ncbi:sensor histidine kinase [Peteryoungia ipomoeae]|uniref:histidine kinase n=1 Tax=Peteryoungia ipomoeae TaxID=1210932 RepID=A0A4S8P7I6_9HYPH|nr:sensor histidine kinase [Peteryoungia ipomoeae]THV24712.1 sensor histidine kinase [Peteryoungia ipomoeae]
MMRSIRARFVVLSLVSVGLLLVLAGFVFVDLFDRSLERRVVEDLDRHTVEVIGNLRLAANGDLILSEKSQDPRFQEPLGGLYWQVTDDRSALLRSPSLWDTQLALPPPRPDPGANRQYRISGPEGAALLAHERVVSFGSGSDTRIVRTVVAMDTVGLVEARRAFTVDIIPYLAILALLLVGLSLLQLNIGLRPLARLNRGLHRVRSRQSERLDGSFPTELDATVEALNRLLDEQQKAIDKARARAADLAHGLKTPLTVLSNDAQTLIERGETDLGVELAHIAQVMQSHLQRELSLSRIATNRASCREDSFVAPTVASIVRTLRRTPSGEYLDWTMDIRDDVKVPLDRQDLGELLGNILENASKWAKTSVSVTARTSATGSVLTISDDGPGVAEDMRDRLTTRGARLDMKMPGDGLGLSIVQEIVDAYGLQLAFRNRPQGGLEVELRFQA